MHMVSKKDLNSAELETMRISRNPTKVMTANGEVLTKAEATVCVKELNLSVTVMLLEDTFAVLWLGKLCEDHGYTYHWTSSQKPHNSPKMAGKSIATQRTTYRSLSLVYRQALQARLHLHLQHHYRRNHLHEDQDNKGSLQKTHQRSHTSCWKFFLIW